MTEPQTVLAASIATVGATTCTVGDVLGFPASGTFTVRIGSERILVGAGAGTTSWSSLTRGYQQTTAATHAQGDAVVLIPDLVTTAGDEAANSYLSVADADALATDDLGPEAAAWIAATTASKQSALKRATREIDEYLRTGWAPYSTTQRLRFPRSIDLDADDAPIIPRGIELATYQQAIYVLKNATVLAAANTRRARNMESASEPNVSYSEGADDGMTILSSQALHYLSGFRVAPTSTRAGSVRSVRVASGFVGTP
jgi:hypothetical protein